MASWTRTDARSVVSVQAATDTPPADGSEDGLSLDSVGGFAVGFECDAGQTFSAPVPRAFKGYLRIGTDWYRAEDIDVDVTAEHVGKRRFAVGGWTVSHPYNRVAHIADGVALSGGGLTLKYETTDFLGRKV